ENLRDTAVCNAIAKSDCNAEPDGDANAYAKRNADSNTEPYTQSDTEAAPDSASSADASVIGIGRAVREITKVSNSGTREATREFLLLSVGDWGAHASRVLVLASRRNSLSLDWPVAGNLAR